MIMVKVVQYMYVVNRVEICTNHDAYASYNVHAVSCLYQTLHHVVFIVLLMVFVILLRMPDMI